MALTGNEFLKQINKGMDITPEEFYPSVKELVEKGIYSVIKYDTQLKKKLEAYINTMNGIVVEYKFEEGIELNKDFSDKLTSKFYRENTMYINASEEEKKYIDELVAKLNEFTMIFQCSDKPVKSEAEPEERIGYDAEKKENISNVKEETPFARTMNYNINA